MECGTTLSVSPRVPARLTDLRGVGPELERKFTALGIATPRDLAASFPRAYKDWRHPMPIADVGRLPLARLGERGDAESSEAIVVATIERISVFRGRVAVVSAELADDTGRLRASWFGRRRVGLDVGDRIFAYGRAALRRSRGAAHVEFNVLAHRKLGPQEPYVGSMVPVYRASKELPSRTIAATIGRNLDALAAFVPEWIPEAILTRHGFLPLERAWRTIHAPPSPEAAVAARATLVFEQFFAIALAAAIKRARRQAIAGATVLAEPATLRARFAAILPFALTEAQVRAIDEIWSDMGGPVPMNRLLQGDVGSGKTLVAAAAIALAAACGVQSALLAPTEIVALQHARKLSPLLLPLGIRVDTLLGSTGTRARDDILGRLANGGSDLLIGTHALLEADVRFADLGLAVIDEQHRFGVAQRATLRAKGRAPHTLYLTATPIPRTLAQTRYADLDVTTIDGLPPGRTPIQTFVVRESRKERAYAFVRASVALGRQAYIVAPAIDEGGVGTSVTAELEAVRAGEFAGLRVGLLHGRLPRREKDAVMGSFASGEIDVLLATTVVEVGVDVPNASVMIVLDAHRFGLAQLHQLRGRVGRGAAASVCVLIAPDDRADTARLEVLTTSTDGFYIAGEDLRLRGEGEFAGTSQSGVHELLGSFTSDSDLYALARAEASAIATSDPELTQPEHRHLTARIDDENGGRATLLTS